MKWRQRELEFRAYVPKTHHMYKDFKGIGEYAVLEDNYALSITSPNIIKVQYTGVKDINGKKIFEGDIVEFKNMNREATVTIVKYCTHSASFLLYCRYGESDIGEETENPRQRLPEPGAGREV